MNKSKAKLLISFHTSNCWMNDGDLTEKFEFKDIDKEPLKKQLGKIVYKLFVVANRFKAITELESSK